MTDLTCEHCANGISYSRIRINGRRYHDVRTSDTTHEAVVCGLDANVEHRYVGSIENPTDVGPPRLLVYETLRAGERIDIDFYGTSKLLVAGMELCRTPIP